MIKKHLPNFLTSLNVLSGSIAVVLILNGKLTMAVVLILFAAIFDFLDGMTARLLKAYSPIGKELDSLADMISFGLAPGLIVYKLIGAAQASAHPEGLTTDQIVITGVAFLIPVFSALRLAKFNVDERQTSSFIGLPTPANALFISSLALIKEHGNLPVIDGWLLSTPSLIFLTLLFCWLLVAEIPMFSLKFKNTSWKDNRIQYIFLISSGLLLLLLQLYGITAVIVLFILMSLLSGKK